MLVMGLCIRKDCRECSTHFVHPLYSISTAGQQKIILCQESCFQHMHQRAGSTWCGFLIITWLRVNLGFPELWFVTSCRSLGYLRPQIAFPKQHHWKLTSELLTLESRSNHICRASSLLRSLDFGSHCLKRLQPGALKYSLPHMANELKESTLHRLRWDLPEVCSIKVVRDLKRFLRGH